LKTVSNNSKGLAKGLKKFRVMFKVLEDGLELEM
jgi:hypothetical protein